MSPEKPVIRVILFESASPTPYAPVVPYMPKTPFLHLFDPEMVPTLQAIWWCMHLPGTFFHGMDLSARELVDSEELDLPHHVLLLPLGVLRAEGAEFALTARDNISLVITPDNAVEEARAYSMNWSPEFGVVPYSHLTSTYLAEHWGHLAALVGQHRASRPIPLTPLVDGGAERLSLYHRLRQFESVSPSQEQCGRRDLVRQALRVSLYARTLATLERSGCTESELDVRYPEVSKTTRPSWHLAIGALGAPAITRRLAASEENIPPAGTLSASIDDERRVLEILVAHRAIARGGFGMCLGDVTEPAFALLRDIEQSVGAARSNNRKAQVTVQIRF